MGYETAPEIRLCLLRGFEVRVDEHPVPLIWSGQRLVAFLALKDRPLTRSYVAGMLWPETTAIKASASLRSALWRAHQSCSSIIDASAQQLALGTTVVVDFRRAIASAQRLLSREVPCQAEDVAAPARLNLSADLLPDWYDDDWVVAEREQFQQLRLHALEAMCERLTAAGRFGEAVDAALAAIRAEPLRESAHQALVKTHLAEGNRLEAVRQYERCRRLLLDELGLEPSSSLQELLATPSLARASMAGSVIDS
jgi:DNA-binding SARP family transcriptional activator